MKTYPAILAALVLAASFSAAAGEAAKLQGEILGTEPNAGYQLASAFDGDLSTNFYAMRSGDYSRPWAGLDLGSNHVISRIGFAPDASSRSCSRLAVFQGAREADFSDALPIAIVPVEGPEPGKMYYIDVNVSRGFRYVRMVGAGGAQLNLAELEFYGTPGDGDDSQFFQVTNLPTIAFNTPGMAEIKSKDDKHPGSTVYVIYDDGRSVLADAQAQMKGRGNASWGMDKKPFQIKFNKKQRILPDAPAKAKKWTLINNHGDKTLMRNRVAFDMSRIIGMEYTPYCTFVDVIYNGEYEGCYQLCDQIEVNDNRVNITEMETSDIEGDALTGGYLLEVDGYADLEPSHFVTYYGVPVTIKSPDEDDITPEQTQYISAYFDAFHRAVYADNFTDPVEGYRKYLDLDSFLRYFICGELNGNTDTYFSTYIYKHRGDDLLYTGPIWDIDLGFNNDNRTYDINSRGGFVYTNGSSAGNMKQLVRRIVENDPEARHRLSVIWSQLRKLPEFNAEYFNGKIDEYAALIDRSQAYNFVRWPILSQWVHMNPTVRHTFKAEVDAVKSYITKRFAGLDKLIGIVDVPDDPGQGGIADATAEHASITFDGAVLTAVGRAGETLDIYSADGRRLLHVVLTGGIDTFDLGALSGILIVRTPRVARKFVK